MKRTILIILVMMMTTAVTLQGQEQPSWYDGWGLGFQVGAGGIFPSGSLSDDFKGCALFTAGINGEYNRLRVKADFAYGQPSFKTPNPYSVIDEQGRDLQLNASSNPALVGLGVQVGYTVLRLGKVSLTPMLGLSWNHMTWNLNHIKYKTDDQGEERPVIDNVTGTSQSSVGWMASVDIDIRLHGKVVDHPLSSSGQGHYASSLRISPFVTHVKCSDLVPPVKGCCVGLTVSYAGLFHSIAVHD